jgi:dTDP-4-amino-4,6-dideoxygalactose transaminase
VRHVPFLDLGALHREIRPALDEAWRRVADSGWFVLGPEVEAFEAEFAAFCGVRFCVGVGNGLEALHLLLRAYGIGPGDEVLVPSNTFIATWLAVSQAGATPVPVEPSAETHTLDPQAIEACITSRTRAVIPVHLYGQPADMDPINDIAARRGLIVIEDAAQAQGARHKGRRCGALGNAAGTSFYPGKNLGALGDAGAVLTDDSAIADAVKRLRNYGSSVKYKHELPGYNSRLDELQAAMLRVKLAVLDEWNARRRRIAAAYSSCLSGSSLQLPVVPDYADPVWHLYVVRSRHRDALQEHLTRSGIGTVIHYPTPPHLQPCYREFAGSRLPVAERAAREVLSLPMSPAMSLEDVEYVAAAIAGFEASERAA